MTDALVKNPERDYSLDSIKMIAALLVVFQHAMGTGHIPGYLLALSRIAVPLFMMVSGFLYIDVVKRGREIKQLKRFIIIAIEMTLLYFVLDFGRSILKGNPQDYLVTVFNAKDVLAFFLWNDPTIADHGWYMWAMIYTLLLAKLFPCIYKNPKIRVMLIIAGIVLSLVFGKYAIALWGKEIIPRYTRNAWCIGIPFFLIGMLIRENNGIIKKISEFKLVMMIVITGILCLVERYFLIYFNVNAARDNYIFMSMLAVLVFIYLYKNKPLKKKNIIADWGIKYSLVIYIIHPLFVRVEYAVFDMGTWWQYIGLIIVLIISLVSAMILKWMDKLIIRIIKK